LSALAEALHRFDPPWIKVGRVYRRICFLRSEGLGAEARRIEDTELADAVAEARGASGAQADADTRLRAFYAEEEERVAEAIALVEVLVPSLSERLSALAPARGGEAAVAVPKTPRRGTAGEEHGIADFIDEMLAQERAGFR
jgi:hypothetical protein